MTKVSPEDVKRSFYKPLYHMEAGGGIVLRDERTGALYVAKRLAVYNADVYAYLKTHHEAHVAGVEDYFLNDDGTLTVIEAYVGGKPLDTCIDELNEQAKRRVLCDVCDALVFLHGADPPIIHRDVKPANIIVTHDGRGVLIDYDAAKIEKTGETRDTILLGTDGVAAPEQYGFGASDVRTDVYGVGMLIKALFPGDPAYQKIADKATRLLPKERYQSVRALKQALQRTSCAKNGWPSLKKIIIAAIVYAFWFYIGATLEFSQNMPTAQVWFERIGAIVVFVITLEPIFAWLPITRSLPGRQSKSLPVRILAAAAWAALWCFIAVFAFALVDTIIF